MGWNEKEKHGKRLKANFIISMCFAFVRRPNQPLFRLLLLLLLFSVVVIC